jgi:hypothetical protein
MIFRKIQETQAISPTADRRFSPVPVPGIVRQHVTAARPDGARDHAKMRPRISGER